MVPRQLPHSISHCNVQVFKMLTSIHSILPPVLQVKFLKLYCIHCRFVCQYHPLLFFYCFDTVGLKKSFNYRVQSPHTLNLEDRENYRESLLRPYNFGVLVPSAFQFYGCQLEVLFWVLATSWRAFTTCNNVRVWPYHSLNLVVSKALGTLVLTTHVVVPVLFISPLFQGWLMIASFRWRFPVLTTSGINFLVVSL